MVKLYGDCIPLCIVFSDARKRKEIETFHEHVNIVVPRTPVISGYESFFSLAITGNMACFHVLILVHVGFATVQS